MRVGMEEPVVHDLRHEALGQALAQLRRIKAHRAQGGNVVDHGAFDEVHDQHVVGTEMRVRARALHPRLIVEELAEPHEVVLLDAKVKLLARRALQLGDQVVQRQLDAVGCAGEPHERHRLADEREVLRHLLHHVRSTHLDGHVRPRLRSVGRQRDRRGAGARSRIANRMRRDARPVHLGDGRRSERLLLDARERFPPRMPQRFLDGGEHRGERHGRHVGAQPLERVGVRGWDDVAAVRRDLSHLHERGAQVLKQAGRLFRREARQHAMLPQDALDLAQAPPRPRPFVASRLHGHLRHFLERGHAAPPRLACSTYIRQPSVPWRHAASAPVAQRLSDGCRAGGRRAETHAAPACADRGG